MLGARCAASEIYRISIIIIIIIIIINLFESKIQEQNYTARQYEQHIKVITAALIQCDCHNSDYETTILDADCHQAELNSTHE